MDQIIWTQFELALDHNRVVVKFVQRWIVRRPRVEVPIRRHELVGMN